MVSICAPTSGRCAPLNVAHVESSFFDDRSMFPAATVEFDNALLMRNIEHKWHARESLSAG